MVRLFVMKKTIQVKTSAFTFSVQPLLLLRLSAQTAPSLHQTMSLCATAAPSAPTLWRMIVLMSLGVIWIVLLGIAMDTAVRALLKKQILSMYEEKG
jgi:hypothetical protein